MEIPTTSVSCPSCNHPVLSDFYFCPNCGKQLHAKAIVVSIPKQIGIYLFSFFLAPLGLYFAFKYINQPLKKTKAVGWVIIFVTIFSIGVATYWVSNIFQQYLHLLNSFSV